MMQDDVDKDPKHSSEIIMVVKNTYYADITKHQFLQQLQMKNVLNILSNLIDETGKTASNSTLSIITANRYARVGAVDKVVLNDN